MYAPVWGPGQRNVIVNAGVVFVGDLREGGESFQGTEVRGVGGHLEGVDWLAHWIDEKVVFGV